ncbi:GntR family transcriptional regulator [Microbacterium sp. STN6]|uniref:GntR family transcriptional regulator n=1 Tax=Microbacterium sp. STN6 TaxID=2995588 RepID=UPI0022609C30|nr:GntR family transcriptional regulator [Microbacterium sp. STN6]MCX7522462.1 GntR family transcriptional regulator [Microbacterium sp. STN6]
MAETTVSSDEARAPTNQTSQLYERMRAAILALELEPGRPLSERGLESAFGASRTPARAALARLEGEGLVQRSGRGWVVSPIDLGEIRALAEYREVLEAAAVRLAVQRASAADFNAVRALLEAARPADEEAGVRAGGDFHSELARLSGNEFLTAGVQAAMTRLARTRWLEVRTAKAREAAWREHAAILEAVATRNADEAARLVTEHVRGTNERLIASLSAGHQAFRARGLAIVPEGTN